MNLNKTFYAKNILTCVILCLFVATFFYACSALNKKGSSTTPNIDIVDISEDSATISIEVVVPINSKEFVKDNMEKIKKILEKAMKNLDDPELTDILNDPNKVITYIKELKVE